MSRIKYGSFKTMTKEEQIQHRRELDRNWRHNHPEWVKEQNKFYYELRKKTKPAICTCKMCGCQFNEMRDYYKICPDCRKLPSKTKLLRMETAKRKEKRVQKYKDMYDKMKAGWKTSKIAKEYNTSMSYIGYCIQRYKTIKS